MGRIRAIAIVAASVAALGCGGGFAVGRPWDAASEATVFDDGIDVIDDLDKLAGEWIFKARQDLDARASLADMVAVVSVMSVQTTKDIDGTEARRIDARVERVLYGKTPARNLALESTASALGNALIVRHESRLTGQYLVFLRWFALEDGTLGHHFHLSPATGPVYEKAKERVDARIAEETASKKDKKKE
jgi:hypothetical protein